MIAMIANSRFKWASHPGTGNKSCRVNADEKLRLTNVLIDRAQANEFLKVLYATGEAPILVDFSNRRTSTRWGTAWSIMRRVTIYRHTVWVFLHELAHILDVKKEFTGYPAGYTVPSRKPHGPDFGSHLTCLYEMWMENCDKGVINTPQKKDAPNLEHDYFVFDEAEKAIPNKWKVPQRRPRTVGGISLQVDDGVWFKAKGRKIFARVLRVNKKTCRVKPIDGSPDWRVSPKLLNKTYLPK